MERRFCQDAVEFRANEAGGTTVSGYAAVFYRADQPGTEFAMYPDLVERIDGRAFDRAIQESHDVRGLFNHDPSLLLGRTKAGTLRLSVDQRGLRYEIDLPATTVGNDVAESIRRGDLSGSSFAFEPSKVEWSRDDKNKRDVRVIRDLSLYDVGPVTYPAYEATTAGMRSSQEAVTRERDSWRLEKEAVRVRLRMMELDRS
jgi:phage prohead protease, HK97 family